MYKLKSVEFLIVYGIWDKRKSNEQADEETIIISDFIHSYTGLYQAKQQWVTLLLSKKQSLIKTDCSKMPSSFKKPWIHL